MDVAIAPANVEMAAAWDGEEGDDWTEHAERYEASGRHLRPRLGLGALVTSTSRVLDIGCGTGRATLDAARAATEGLAVGVDLSSRMLAYARDRARAEGVTNAEFLQTDAQVHPFEPAAFDVKAGEMERARGELVPAATALLERGSDALVLACTELPLVPCAAELRPRMVDPTMALARAIVAHSRGAPCEPAGADVS